MGALLSRQTRKLLGSISWTRVEGQQDINYLILMNGMAAGMQLHNGTPMAVHEEGKTTFAFYVSGWDLWWDGYKKSKQRIDYLLDTCKEMLEHGKREEIQTEIKFIDQ